MIVFYILLCRSRQFLCRGAVKNPGRRKHEPERLVQQRTLKNADFQVPKTSHMKANDFLVEPIN